MMSDKLLDFGDYVFIEMKRHGIKNEFYKHKVISQLSSNTYVDVPVQDPAKEVIHDNVVPVVSCICCGVDETKVLKFMVDDVCPCIRDYEMPVFDCGVWTACTRHGMFWNLFKPDDPRSTDKNGLHEAIKAVEEIAKTGQPLFGGWR